MPALYMVRVTLIIFRLMFDLDEFFSGDVTLHEVVGSHDFAALTQDFCFDYDIYSAEKNNLNIPHQTDICPNKEIYRNDDLLLRNLDEDGPSFYSGVESVIEVVASEVEALEEECKPLRPETASHLYIGAETELDAEGKDEITSAASLKITDEDHSGTGRTFVGKKPDELPRPTVPSFRTVPARLKVRHRGL